MVSHTLVHSSVTLQLFRQTLEMLVRFVASSFLHFPPFFNSLRSSFDDSSVCLPCSRSSQRVLVYLRLSFLYSSFLFRCTRSFLRSFPSSLCSLAHFSISRFFPLVVFATSPSFIVLPRIPLLFISSLRSLDRNSACLLASFPSLFSSSQKHSRRSLHIFSS